jgi:hypothetical protein
MARIAEGGQGRRVDKAIALTTLSPVRRDRRAELDRRLSLVARFPPLGRPLAELAFIHYARWTVLEWVPKPDGSGARTPLASSYLFFESNYNGGADDYLNAFAAVIPYRLARLWGTCQEFEETVLRADGAEGRLIAPWAFRSYVERNELEVLHFYAAYPEATMIDVRQALAVAEERSRAAQRSGWALEDSVRRAVRLVIGPEPEPLVGLPVAKRYAIAQWRALKRSYGVNPFALLAPVDPEAADDLFRRLADEWCDEKSPLDKLTDTHYARLVRVPPELKDLGQPAPDSLDTPYLLYTSNHRGSAREHIRRLRDELGPVADEIWRHCPGYPGHDEKAAFDDWAGRHTIGTRYFAAGYEPRDIEDIEKALTDRTRMREELWEHGPSPAWLRGDAA